MDIGHASEQLQKLKDRTLAEVPQARGKMLELDLLVKQRSDAILHAKNDERSQASRYSDEYWQEIFDATAPDSTFRPHVNTYEVRRDRPPPPQDLAVADLY